MSKLEGILMNNQATRNLMALILCIAVSSGILFIIIISQPAFTEVENMIMALMGGVFGYMYGSKGGGQ